MGIYNFIFLCYNTLELRNGGNMKLFGIFQKNVKNKKNQEKYLEQFAIKNGLTVDELKAMLIAEQIFVDKDEKNEHKTENVDEELHA